MEPELSIIIPVLDGRETIAEQLRALLTQTPARATEVIVADNGSTDGTQAMVAREFSDVLLVDASSRRGPGAARNIAVARSRGRRLAFLDADDRVCDGWLVAMLGALENDHLCAGGWVSMEQGAAGVPAAPRPVKQYLPYASTCNCAMPRQMFDSAGGFREEFMVAEDVDLSWRLQQAGYELHAVPEALVLKRRRRSALGAFRQHLAGGWYDVLLYRHHAEKGMPGTRLLALARSLAWLAVSVRKLGNERTRGVWIRKLAGHLGRAAASLRYGVLYL